MSDITIGLVGTGAMGGPMAANLARAGHPVRVFDADPEVLARVAETPGLEVRASAGDVAAHVDVLFTCLPDDAVVDAVYLGDGGVIDAGRPGLVTVDCSTVSPAVTRKVFGALAPKEISHADASMLGSVTQAEAGEIGFMVGGEERAFEAVRPLLEVMGKMVRHVGPSGSANTMKLIHQTLVAGHAVSVAEALALCLQAGADVETFYDIVCEGGGFAHSRYFENRVPRMRAGEFSPFFMLKFMLKDARLALDLAAGTGTTLPVLERVVGAFEEAADGGWGEDDFSAVVHVLEKRIGKAVAKA